MLRRLQRPKQCRGVVEHAARLLILFRSRLLPHSNLLQDTLLELPLDLLALIVRTRLAVQGHQSSQVKLGSLEELDFANVNLKHTKLSVRRLMSKLTSHSSVSLTFWRG